MCKTALWVEFAPRPSSEDRNWVMVVGVSELLVSHVAAELLVTTAPRRFLGVHRIPHRQLRHLNCEEGVQNMPQNRYPHTASCPAAVTTALIKTKGMWTAATAHELLAAPAFGCSRLGRRDAQLVACLERESHKPLPTAIDLPLQEPLRPALSAPPKELRSFEHFLRHWARLDMATAVEALGAQSYPAWWRTAPGRASESSRSGASGSLTWSCGCRRTSVCMCPAPRVPESLRSACWRSSNEALRSSKTLSCFPSEGNCFLYGLCGLVRGSLALPSLLAAAAGAAAIVTFGEALAHGAAAGRLAEAL